MIVADGDRADDIYLLFGSLQKKFANFYFKPQVP